MATLPPLAAVSDLAAWVGASIDASDLRAGAVLSAASALARAETGRTWVDDTGALVEVPDDVSTVVVQVAARVWRNPNGTTSTRIGSLSLGFDSDIADGLYLTDTERTILGRYRTSGAPSGLGVLSTTRDEGYGRTEYVPTAPQPAGYPFPWYDADDL